MKLIESLPPEKVEALFRALRQKKRSAKRVSAARTPARGKVAWPDLNEWRSRVFGNKLMPNPILEERESYTT